MRANLGLHAAWYLSGTAFDGLIGQSYRTAKDNLFPEESGLHDQVSDVVARASFAPTQWLDLTYRTRLDQATLATRMIDAFASGRHREILGECRLSLHHRQSLSCSTTSRRRRRPARRYYFTPRSEVTLGSTCAGASTG